MKRTIAALIAAVGLATTPFGTAQAAPPDDAVRGPSCGDITADAHYSTPSGAPGPVLGGTINTASASCTRLSYTMDVYPTGAAAPALFSQSIQGDGTTGTESPFIYTWAPDDPAPTAVCVHFTSTDTNGRVVDEAPNAPAGDCAIGAHFALDGGTGGSPMK